MEFGREPVNILRNQHVVYAAGKHPGTHTYDNYYRCLENLLTSDKDNEGTLIKGPWNIELKNRQKPVQQMSLRCIRISLLVEACG